jgi:uncharacterized membrane protein YkoI
MVILALGIAGALAPASGHQHKEESKAGIARIAGMANIDLGEAVALALEEHPGRAVEAELEGEIEEGELVVVYEVEILHDDGSVYEIELDARDGRLLEKELEEDEDDVLEYLEVLEEAQIDLGSCIRNAEAEGRGGAVEAELEMEDGIPVCEVLTFDGENVWEIELDMRDGSLIEIEREHHHMDEHGEHDHRHGHGGDSEDEDED